MTARGFRGVTGCTAAAQWACVLQVLCTARHVYRKAHLGEDAGVSAQGKEVAHPGLDVEELECMSVHRCLQWGIGYMLDFWIVGLHEARLEYCKYILYCPGAPRVWPPPPPPPPHPTAPHL